MSAHSFRAKSPHTLGHILFCWNAFDGFGRYPITLHPITVSSTANALDAIATHSILVIWIVFCLNFRFECMCLNHSCTVVIFPICRRIFISPGCLCLLLVFISVHLVSCFSFITLHSLSKHTLDWTIYSIEQCAQCKLNSELNQRCNHRHEQQTQRSILLHNVTQSITNSCWRFVFFLVLLLIPRSLPRFVSIFFLDLVCFSFYGIRFHFLLFFSAHFSFFFSLLSLRNTLGCARVFISVCC